MNKSVFYMCFIQYNTNNIKKFEEYNTTLIILILNIEIHIT